MTDSDQVPLLGAIADDLTGGTDLALTLSRGGMRVRQVVGVPDARTPLVGADAVVVSLKSRTVPATDAVAQSRASAEALLAAGARQLFFKYCSTFDSNDDGNIGPVTDALMELLGEERTLVCPAFPTNARTVYQGYLFVGDQLLSESSMKDHPLTPMRDPSIVRMMRRQSKLPVSLIDIAQVREGPEALRDALNARSGVAVIDALDDADLLTIGAAARHLGLITGGSGVALGLPANFDLVRGGRSETRQPATGRAVVLAGSCSAATHRQVNVALDRGMPGFRIDPLKIADASLIPDDAVSFAAQTSAEQVPMIYATADSDAVRHAQQALGRERSGALVEEFLGSVAQGLAARGFDRILVAGGESSGAVIAGLGISELDVGPEIDPGVPWMLADRDGQPVSVALKSGNFGADEIFVTAWDKLG